MAPSHLLLSTVCKGAAASSDLEQACPLQMAVFLFLILIPQSMSFLTKISPLLCKGPRCWMCGQSDLEELERIAGFWLPHDYVALLGGDSGGYDRFDVDLRRGLLMSKGCLHLYNTSDVKKNIITHGLPGVLPQAVIIGHNGRGGMLVLAGGMAQPNGIYRVTAEQLASDGLVKAVFIAPDVTALMHHGQGLDRVFLPLWWVNKMKARAWEVAVQQSRVRAFERHAKKAGSVRWRFAGLHEQMLLAARVAEDPVLLSPDWPEVLADRVWAMHFSGLQSMPSGRLNFPVEAGTAPQTQELVGRGAPLLPRLHPCLRPIEKIRPPPPLDVLRLLDSLSMPAQEEYLDLMDECGSLKLAVELQEEGHAGKERMLLIEQPRHCWERRAMAQDPEVLPPFLVLGHNWSYHLLAYSTVMEPPGLYRLAKYGAYDGDPNPVFLTDSLESLLVRGEGLTTFFQPVLEHEQAVERLAKLGAEVKGQDESSAEWGDGSGQHFRHHLRDRTVLEDLIINYLTPDIYDPESLAERCQRSWPKNAELRVFKVMLKAALDEPGLVTPQMYDHWTGGDDSYDTQAKLQAHLQYLWNLCFPSELRNDVTG